MKPLVHAIEARVSHTAVDGILDVAAAYIPLCAELLMKFVYNIQIQTLIIFWDIPLLQNTSNFRFNIMLINTLYFYFATYMSTFSTT